MLCYLMRSELAVIEMLHSKLGVIFAAEFNNTRAIFEHIGVTYVACFTHVILQILPATTGWNTYEVERRQPCYMVGVRQVFIAKFLNFFRSNSHFFMTTSCRIY